MRWSCMSLLSVGVILAGCQSDPLDSDDSDVLTKTQRRDKNIGKLFGEDISFFGENKESRKETVGIAVNEYLWRASLDTVSFMPLRTVDPFGGVILTEWYTPETAPNERLKVDIFILDRQLTSNGIKVAIHKQLFNPKTTKWVDSPVDKKTLNDFEEVILTRARQLKVAHKV